MEHLRSGVAVLRSWKPKTRSERVLKEDFLSPVYTRSYESVDPDDGYQRFCERFLDLATTPTQFRGATTGMPDSFEDVQDARKKLQTLLDVLFPLIASLIGSADDRGLQATIARARKLMQEWNTRFHELPSVRKDNTRSRRTKILLDIQYEIGLILLTAIPLGNEEEFDRYTGAFRHIVRECQQFLDIEKDVASSRGDFTCCFDLGIIPPLFFSASNCRDPQIRREAIDLLRTSNRSEGVWGGKIAGLMAEETMKVEEEGLLDVRTCADIPSHRRARITAMQYNPGSCMIAELYAIVLLPEMSVCADISTVGSLPLRQNHPIML